MKSTNVGGWLDACVPKDAGLLAAADRVRVLLHELGDEGVDLACRMRVSHDSSAVSSAGTSFSRWRPVRAEMFTRGAQATCARSCSISRSR